MAGKGSNRTFRMTQGFVPGNFVRHPDQPGWGVGQVQSVAGGRATVNFENAGKRVIILDNVRLVADDPASTSQAKQKNRINTRER